MIGIDWAKAYRKAGLGMLLALGLALCSPDFAAADPALENTQLALLLRQLDALDRTALQAAASASIEARYRFDYARLHADIARVRAGIEDYLTPPRAQPRDPSSLSGEYRTERAVKP